MKTCLTLVAFALSCAQLIAADKAKSSWTQYAPREEIRPEFIHLRNIHDTDETEILIINADDRDGIAGSWNRVFPVKGGQHYRFSVMRRTKGIDTPRRCALAKITWTDSKGNLVDGYQGDRARPEYPSDRGAMKGGWTIVGDTYHVPTKATQAKVELQLRWVRNATVQWQATSLKPVDPPKQRIVRLASVHFRPQGLKSAQQNRESFAPHLATAAAKKADLVCLGECLTMVGTGMKYVDVAESVPGPSTEYFGKLAKQHDLYIVAGIVEREGTAIYNTAILMGPDGKLAGKYRKVCLPREEIEGGVTPGKNYPVFKTRFGKLGMMICWDVHFPEVARNLSNNGAEVIAMPIWGGNPALAQARAIENQIFLVSSTYTAHGRAWMKSAIWDQEGKMLAVGTKWGQVHVVEVDLGLRKQWSWLGDFKARIYRERPENGFQN